MIDCKKNKTLERDGTNQAQRYLKALKFSYIQIDERNFYDLLKFIEGFAKLVQYYNFHDEKEGNWSVFYSLATDKINDSSLKKYLKELLLPNNPHQALTIVFLLLFRYAQNHINTLTKKHIEFYYKEILQLKEKPATADQAHILFTLAKHIDKYLVPKGTELLAGKDATGIPLYYKTLFDTTINKAKIEKLKTIFNDSLGSSRIYAAPVANSTDGKGKETGEFKWDTFGKNQKVEINNKFEDIQPRSMIDAEIGFAIASPLLWLREGIRTIYFKISFQENLLQHKIKGMTITSGNLSKAFHVKLSGEKGWIEKSIIADGTVNYSENNILIIVPLQADDPAVVAYNESIYGEGYSVSLPMAKIILNNANDQYAYKVLNSLRIKSITIDLDIHETKTIYVQNNLSVLDSTKTFQPFGPFPAKGNEFYIGHAEAFQKKLKSFSVNIEWQNAPANFHTHYGDYYATSPENTAFTFDIQLLYKKHWSKLIPSDNYLFNSSDASKPKTIEVNSVDTDNKPYRTEIKESEINGYNSGTASGFIKIQLTGPTTPINAFGHTDYTTIYTERIINKTKPPTVPAANTTIPKEPYTPAIKSLSVNYYSSETIIDNINSSNADSKFFHIGPFGYEAFVPNDFILPSVPLLPQFSFEGALYIGLNQLDPPGQLSLLFHVAEGSSDATIKIRPSIKWCYLSKNSWIEFLPNQVLMDTTQELRKSGVIVFDIPKNTSADASILDNGYYWLRASAGENAGAINLLIQIHAQVAIGGFVDKGNDSNHLRQPLPANSITRLAINDPAIKTIEQPFASFGGKTTEQSSDFYPRASERLRHKNRAISIWDYEHLVLEHFPSVYKVKCLPHTDIDGNVRAGCVTLVVISNLYNKNAIDMLRPTTSEGELNEIKLWLEGHVTLNRLASPFISLSVKNPTFEEIEVSFKVKFKSGDQGLNLIRLNNDIKEYLSPWAYKEGPDIIFEGKIHKSLIIYFVEKLDYVDYITNFSMKQTTYDNKKPEDIAIAEASRPDIILVSAKNHPSIELINEEECPESI